MEFKELTSDELELLNEEERAQYDKERDLYNKRVAFVQYMEKMGALKIEQLEKRELKPIPVVKNPEVPEFEKPDPQQMPVSRVEVPEYSVLPYEACSVSVPEIEKVKSEGYGSGIRKIEKIRPELKEYPEFVRIDDFSAEFVLPEKKKFYGMEKIAAPDLPEIRNMETGSMAAVNVEDRIGHITVTEADVPGFEKPEAVKFETAQIFGPEIMIPEKISASAGEISVKCSVPAAAEIREIRIDRKDPTVPEIRRPEVSVPGMEVCEARTLPAAKIRVPEVMVPESVSCEVRTLPAAEIHVPEVAVPEGVSCEVRTLPATEIRVPEVAVPESAACAVPEIRMDFVQPVEYKIPGFRSAEPRQVRPVSFRIPDRKEESFRELKVKELQTRKIAVPEVRNARKAGWTACEPAVVHTEKIVPPSVEIPQYAAPDSVNRMIDKISVDVKIPDMEAMDFELRQNVVRPDHEERKRQLMEKAESLKNIAIPENWQDVLFGAENNR